ncbi:MAG: UDP-galactopyranose mutase [bacterium]
MLHTEIKHFKPDIVIVGCGISGIVIAERYANILHKKILIVEKRNHIGGNCYDYYNKDGILVHKYGAHIFHTSIDEVWNYVNRFSEFTPFRLKVRSCYDGKNTVPIPVNIDTVNTLFGLKIETEKEMEAWLEKERVHIDSPTNSEESVISRMGRRIYEIMFKNYFKKQWDLWPAQVDASVNNRIPIRTNHDDTYFTDTFQAMPSHGYTKLFEKMLENDNIKVVLNTDYFEIKNQLSGFEKLFFTGPVDRFFDHKFGKLQYRSLNFEFTTYDQESYLEEAVIAYPNTEKFTRIVEYKKLTGQKKLKTTVSREISTWEGDPFYPVPNKQNWDLYEKYKSEAEKIEQENGRIFFVGRLANYKYFNMDQTFKNALDLFYSIENLEKDF